MCGAIIAAAVIGKFGGTALAARWTGMPWRDSLALGALMNTRGLMELIVLNIGYDLEHHVASDVHDDGHDGAGDDVYGRAAAREY